MKVKELIAILQTKNQSIDVFIVDRPITEQDIIEGFVSADGWVAYKKSDEHFNPAILLDKY